MTEAEKIEALEAAGELEQAAVSAQQSGHYSRAASLFERACLFEQAARCALVASDLQRAVTLAALTCDDALVQETVHALAALPAQARATASALCARGHDGVAGLLLQEIGDQREAAKAFLSARQPLLAAKALENAGDLPFAARVLESALREEPHDEELIVAAGTLLTRAQRYEPAIRLLQRIPSQSSKRPQVLSSLSLCFDALGLRGPRMAIEHEALSRGLVLTHFANSSSASGEAVMLGRYQVIRTAASSQSARVLEAVDRLTQRRVAIKQLLVASMVGSGRDAFFRLVREARILERLRHPNIVPLIELVEDAAAIITPWMPGGSLSTQIAQHPISPGRAVEITCAVLSALAEAHRIGILHRDIKPSNILFDDAGVPYLADFGAAHISDSSATATAGVIGTLAYMSPEQRKGEPAVPASDLFGVGATLLQMLTGQVPDPSSTSSSFPSGSNSELNEEHDQVVLALLHQDPAMRPASALAARELLSALDWPATIPDRLANQTQSFHPQPQETRRIIPIRDNLWTDTWLRRQVLVLPLNEFTLNLARALATIDSQQLPTVLRVDLHVQQVWIEPPTGVTLAHASVSISQSDLNALRSAVRKLHAHSIALGAIDPDHIQLHDNAISLALDLDAIEHATRQDDEQALARLERSLLSHSA